MIDTGEAYPDIWNEYWKHGQPFSYNTDRKDRQDSIISQKGEWL